MSNTIIRTCQQCDLARVEQFVQQMYEEDSGAHSGKPNIRLTFAELETYPEKGRIVVLETDAQISGYAIFIFYWSNEFCGNIIEVDELFVEKSFRGQGLAREFFAWLKESYKENAVGFSLQVSESNKRALKLYEELGFRKSINMHMLKLFAADSVGDEKLASCKSF